MADVHKILIIRLSSIGDIILTTPLLRSIRKTYPKASITYITKKQYAGLLADSPYISELIAFDKSEGFRGLRKIKRQSEKPEFRCLSGHTQKLEIPVFANRAWSQINYYLSEIHYPPGISYTV